MSIGISERTRGVEKRGYPLFRTFGIWASITPLRYFGRYFVTLFWAKSILCHKCVIFLLLRDTLITSVMFIWIGCCVGREWQNKPRRGKGTGVGCLPKKRIIAHLTLLEALIMNVIVLAVWEGWGNFIPSWSTKNWGRPRVKIECRDHIRHRLATLPAHATYILAHLCKWPWPPVTQETR